MAVFNNILAGASGQAGGAAAGAENRSLRFNSADTPSLTRAITTGKTTWTLSLWVKRTNLSNYHCIFSSGSSGANATGIFFDTASGTFYAYGSGNNYYSTEVYRDFSAWYHIVISVNSNSGTVYVNGQSVTFSPSLAFTTLYNNAVLGAYGTSGLYYFDGYMADVHFIDGQALAATDFGELDDNGVWQPIEYAGTYGTDGARLPFSDNSSASALGTDDSGNGNDWTVNNIATGSAPSGSNVGLYLADGTPTAGSISDMFDGDTSTTYYYRAIGGTLTLYFTEPVSGDFVITAADGTSLTNSGGGYKLYDSSGTLLVNQSSPTTTTTNTHSSLSNVKKLEMIGGSGYGGILIYEISVSGVTFQETLNPPDEDSLRDSPTNGDTADDTGLGNEVSGNYCTWNPLTKGTYTNGNLDSSNTTYQIGTGTIGVSSGKWYWEVQKTDSGTTHTIVGATPKAYSTSEYLGVTSGEGFGIYFYNGNLINNGSGSGAYGAFSQGDILNVALDMDNGKVWFGKNGTWFNSGNPAAGTNALVTGLTGTYYPGVSSASGTVTCSANFGQRAFAYSAPSGFKALCTANLPTPTLEDGSDYMDATLYTGNGSTKTISGLDFSPDFVWIKRRNLASDHQLYDTVRGPNNGLSTNLTDAEWNYGNGLTAFNSDGFTLGDLGGANRLNDTHVAWTWDGGQPDTASTGAVRFDGSSDYLDVGSALVNTNNSFCVEAFAYLLNNPGTSNMGTICSQYASGLPDGRMLYGFQSGYLAVRINGGTVELQSAAGTIVPHRWYHTAWTWDGTTHRLFLDGELVDTSTTMPAPYTGANTEIGGNSALNAYSMNGYISNFRIVTGSALYTSNFTPPSTELTNVTNTKLLCCQSTASAGAAAVSPNISGINDGTVWSANFTSTSGFGAAYPASKAFDGLDTTYAEPVDTSSTMTVTFNPPLVVSGDFEVLIGSAGELFTTINGGASTSQGSGLTKYHTLGSNITVSNFTYTSSTRPVLYRVRVNGSTILTDPVTKNGDAAATTYNPLDAFSVDGTGYSTASAAGLTSGTITPTGASVNRSAGFSVVAYTGTGANATVGHGLNVTPQFIIVKGRTNSYDWPVYHVSRSYLEYGLLSTTGAFTTSSASFIWNTAPTSSVFGVGAGVFVNALNANYVAYCFAPVEGYSAFGSYIGNGDPGGDGPFVYTGMRPQWIMVKCSSSDQSGNAWWLLYDGKRVGYNSDNKHFGAQASDIEYTANSIDILSNGFKIRDNNTSRNANGATYVYACFAENPFSIARAR